jgi:C-terminal processing protease CtpA/Prc
MTWSSSGLTRGLKTVPITAELRAHYGVPEDRGVLVVRVDDEGPIGRAGIEVGDVLVGVGKEPVSSPAEVRLALVRHDRSVPLSIEVVRKRETVVMELVPVARAAPAPAVAMLFTSEARATHIERSIALLERQLETLRRQLAEIKTDSEAPKADKPASPDR